LFKQFCAPFVAPTNEFFLKLSFRRWRNVSTKINDNPIKCWQIADKYIAICLEFCEGLSRMLTAGNTGGVDMEFVNLIIFVKCAALIPNEFQHCCHSTFYKH